MLVKTTTTNANNNTSVSKTRAVLDVAGIRSGGVRRIIMDWRDHYEKRLYLVQYADEIMLDRPMAGVVGYTNNRNERRGKMSKWRKECILKLKS